MFTGIVQAQGEIVAFALKESGLVATMQVLAPTDFSAGVKLGASVAVDGVCLSLTEYRKEGEKSVLTFDLIAETLAKSSFGNGGDRGNGGDSRSPAGNIGRTVNLERSLKFGDEVGGHIVMGHVNDIGRVAEVHKVGEGKTITLTVSEDLIEYLFPKGFIAVNGVSLTMGDAVTESFDLHLIPDTLSRTNLDALVCGDAVNIEVESTTVAIVEKTKRYLEQRAK